MGVWRKRAFRATTFKLPRFLVLALETKCQEFNAQSGEPPLTVDEYLAWRLIEDITRAELRRMATGVPGMRRLMLLHRKWEHRKLRAIECAERHPARAGV